MRKRNRDETLEKDQRSGTRSLRFRMVSFILKDYSEGILLVELLLISFSL